jgi:hypothetical protein
MTNGIAGIKQETGRNNSGKGGHYAAWEQPQLFSEEVRAGFRSLRSGVAKSD